MLLDREAFRQRFNDCQRSAWRFECQQNYAIPREDDDFSRWRAGQPMPDGHNAAWHDRVQGYVAEGKTVGRVRVLHRPLTEYLRFQLDWAIPGNIAAGEDIRILDVTNLDLDLPAHDFWIFDDSLVVDLNFNPDGTLINRDQRENPDPTQYLKWRDTALAHAVPLSEWNART
ncbi:DUF6879 family protein [Saccharopolyspora phatthalungensis]|uniref:DUF6879 domain-containing protein n=1 Tax=Saccharopolyspora phatthalungensis TaxID=664693 RepID=A0A840QK57_9PSEU|nr:DUF6879 family protein [Saccharopolyspora phatthalungensis]MBB5158593.1 hypothetical protein [Saccharopolyspora phatthalungensis]